ncbi:MAG: hypothetical protein A2V98_12435 [Planctomycetes bacterium RBG_16_64_12]|nr:MAG: hypothetical protein A2V98_12435 [Planctomycetes bacterium RBG_16_64_12]
MSRTTFALIAIALVGMAAGCRMCASPYDYCGPTFTGACGEECSQTARSGSVLSGYVAPYPDDGYLQEPVLPGDETALYNDEAAPQDDEAAPQDDEMASGIILSVTDKKVDEAAEAEPQVVGEAPALPSQGWRAVRPAETTRP